MYLCYIDESGTTDLPGNTSHIVLAGLSIPIQKWRTCDQDIEAIKQRYSLSGQEVHVAWLLRKYLEQSRIPNFSALDYTNRRVQVETLRKAELLQLQNAKKPKQYKQARKTFALTDKYIHLTIDERRRFVGDLADCLSEWGFARLFAECIDKVHFNPVITMKSVAEQSFEQIVSRFETFLELVSTGAKEQLLGLLIHDNNQTVAKKHTELMKHFHSQGTLWTQINNIIETPLFVDSELTGMVQIADLCAYALRRYLENGEQDLFDKVFRVADRKDGVAVGVRHFTKQPCPCLICGAHNRPLP
jgi:hypothetical protein